VIVNLAAVAASGTISQSLPVGNLPNRTLPVAIQDSIDREKRGRSCRGLQESSMSNEDKRKELVSPTPCRDYLSIHFVP